MWILQSFRHIIADQVPKRVCSMVALFARIQEQITHAIPIFSGIQHHPIETELLHLAITYDEEYLLKIL